MGSGGWGMWNAQSISSGNGQGQLVRKEFLCMLVSLCLRANLSNFERHGHAMVLPKQIDLLFGYREFLLVRNNEYKPNAGQIELLGLLAKACGGWLLEPMILPNRHLKQQQFAIVHSGSVAQGLVGKLGIKNGSFLVDHILDGRQR